MKKAGETKNDSKPECFTPEKNMCYPLCVGGKGLKCEKCCLYTNFEPDEAFCNVYYD